MYMLISVVPLIHSVVPLIHSHSEKGDSPKVVRTVPTMKK